MTVEDLIAECPDCGRVVLEMPLQGGMRFDVPAVDRATHPAAIFALSEITPGNWIAGSNGDADGTGHELHAHQPAGVS